MSRIKLSNVVSRQLPEHIREDYPTFVAFVEAYYEYLQVQGVDFTTIRDIDTTLESFIGQFKKELAYNLPNIAKDERFLLQNIKDHYLAKGSEASYKLLFKLLFNKDVQLIYPGRSMLRASDGRWNQEISVFAKVDYGNPETVVGQIIDVETANRIIRVISDTSKDLQVEIDRITLIDPVQNIYEFFLDKNFYGNIIPQDKLRYGESFQATILPATQKLNITQSGKNFRVGQVFELKSGTGTGALVKVTATTPTGGIKYAEIIKFGIGYSADFAVTLLSSNSVTSVGSATTTSFSTLVQQNTYSATAVGAITYDPTIVGAGSFVIGHKYQVTTVGSTNWIALGAGWESAPNLKQDINYTIRQVGTTNWVALGAASNTVGVTFRCNANGASGTGYASPTDFVTTVGTKFIARGIGSGSGSAASLTVTGSATNFGSNDNIQVGDHLTTSNDLYIGIVDSVIDSTTLTIQTLHSDYESGTAVLSTPYTGVYAFRNIRSVGSLYKPYGPQAYTFESALSDRTLGIDEQGYVNLGDWVSSEFVDGTYAGTLIREFSLDFRNAQIQSIDPAVINVSLGAVVKYPGYFETNNGFLDDSIYIQDSKYYQAFSYVVKIDERLSAYSSAVKTMLHPAGMALFGEFNITNNYDLSVSLQSLVNSLGVSLQTSQDVSDSQVTLDVSKILSTSLNTPLDTGIKFSTTKLFSDSSLITQQFSKTHNKNHSEIITTDDDILIGLEFIRQFNEPLLTGEQFGKNIFHTRSENVYSDDNINLSFVSLRNLTDEISLQEAITSIEFAGVYTDQVISSDSILIAAAANQLLSTEYSGLVDSISFANNYFRDLEDNQLTYSVINSIQTYKYVNDVLQPQTESGYVAKNPYSGQDYFASEYSAGLRASTFTTP